MKLAPALAIVSLLVLPAADSAFASPDAGGPRSIAAAKKALEGAQASLAEAVKRIEKDPPSTADLDAAHVAVEALKEAIDAAAEYEASDLDFAKAVLGARKELRTRREYVDDRRAKVHIHEHRRAIDAALASLGDRLKGLEAKEPGAKDFDDARAAAAALKKGVEEARQFAKQDEKFASYLGTVDATVARQEKAIDDRWVLLSADKHRVLVQQSRDALTASMVGLDKGATDAQFAEAGRAAALLSTRLDEGKPLEKEKGYRADAERARSELAQAKKRIDQLMGATILERLKSEIEPAHKDLVAAAKAVRVRNPSADQLAEARTAAVVVRKLVEKFEPQGALSQAFGQYLTTVKKTLVEVEVELSRRGLDSARKDLTAALKNLEKKEPTDEQFEEAKTALVVLEKTFETVNQKEPALEPYVYEARGLIKTGRTTIDKRRIEVDVQRQRAKVEEARKLAATLMGQIGQANTTNEQLQAAEDAVKRIGAALVAGAELTKKDREYAAYDVEVNKRITELNARIAARRITVAVSAGRTQLREAFAAAKAKLEAAKKPEANDADIEAAARSVEAIKKALEARTPLEKQDTGYAADAENARYDLEAVDQVLDFVKQAGALRRQTVEALAAGAVLADSAAATKELRPQKERYEKAVALFRSCESAGQSLVKENHALAVVVLLVEGTPHSPREVVALCEEKAKATEQASMQVAALIGFEDGPRRAYEAGTALLAKSKKPEALTQFYDCIASGKILLHRNPDLKDHPFLVAGATMTLGQVIQKCLDYRDTLQTK